jgi:hypothetical protein
VIHTQPPKIKDEEESKWQNVLFHIISYKIHQSIARRRVEKSPSLLGLFLTSRSKTRDIASLYHFLVAFIIKAAAAKPNRTHKASRQSHHVRRVPARTHVSAVSTRAAATMPLPLRHRRIAHLRHVEVHGPDRRVHAVTARTLDVRVPSALQNKSASSNLVTLG